MKTERCILHNLIWDILKYFEFDTFQSYLFINNNFDSIIAERPDFWDTTIENDEVIFHHNIQGSWLVVKVNPNAE